MECLQMNRVRKVKSSFDFQLQCSLQSRGSDGPFSLHIDDRLSSGGFFQVWMLHRWSSSSVLEVISCTLILEWVVSAGTEKRS